MGIYLSRMLESWPESYNTLLSGLPIDRSTFYKIKSGERKPTKRQFCAIIRRLKPSEEEKRILMEEFEQERLWKKSKQKLLLTVREFLHYLNCKERFRTEELEEDACLLEKKAVPEAVKQIFENELKAENPGKIRIRISPSVLDKYDWKSMWPVLEKTDTVMEMDFLLNNSVQENYDVIRKLRHTEIYFSLMKSGKVKISVYREEFFNKDEEMMQGPYPFYLITSNQIVLIREDLEEFWLVSNQSVTENYQKSFDRRLTHSYAVMEPYDDHETMKKMLLEHFRECAQNKMDIFTLSGEVSRLPAMTEYMIRSLFSEELAEWLCEIRRYYMESDACACVSEREYDQSLKLTHVTEWGERSELGEMARDAIAYGMEQRRINRKLILIPDIYGYIPDQATIHLFGGEEMFLMMWEHSNVLIRIREKELIEGMHHWFRNCEEFREIEDEISKKDPDE